MVVFGLFVVVACSCLCILWYGWSIFRFSVCFCFFFFCDGREMVPSRLHSVELVLFFVVLSELFLSVLLSYCIRFKFSSRVVCGGLLPVNGFVGMDGVR